MNEKKTVLYKDNNPVIVSQYHFKLIIWSFEVY